jgi:hypothetical protein
LATKPTYLNVIPKALPVAQAKMGTSETFKIKAINASSRQSNFQRRAQELKTFIHSGEQVDGAVITIPRPSTLCR